MSRRQFVTRVVADAQRYDALLLNGSSRFDQIVGAIVRRLRPRLPIVLADSTWKRGAAPHVQLTRRLGMRALDGVSVRFCVLSSEEQLLFPLTWSVDPSRVVFTAFHHTLSPATLDRSLTPGKGVFAGGDSMRDYGPLLRVARGLAAPVKIATRDPATIEQGRDIGNVEAGAVSKNDFDDALVASAIVVVPLAAGIERSAGQQTYLNAMGLGKLAIATDSPGARDYIVDRSTGLIVPPGDPDGLRAALEWALDPANAGEIEGIRARARADVLARFTPEAYVERLLAVVRAALVAA